MIRVRATRKGKEWDIPQFAVDNARIKAGALEKAERIVRNHLRRRFPGAMVTVTLEEEEEHGRTVSGRDDG